MRVDLFLIGDSVHNRPEQVPSLLVEYGATAERSGFDGVWLAEHHFIRYGACPSATLLAGHLLARTSTLRVGTAACVLSNRHPVALAEEAAMLDGLSGGRFMLGVARGGPWVDLEVFGVGEARFARGFPESLDLLLDWTSGADRVGAAGEFFYFRPVDVLAKPSGDLGVWVAATSEDTVETAARRGLPLLLGVHASEEEKAALLRRHAEVAASCGHDPDGFEHAAVYLAHAADSAEAARDRLRRPLTEWLAEGVGDYVRLNGSRGSRDQAGYAERLLGSPLVGPASESAVAAAAEIGLKRILLLVEGPREPRAVRENIERLGARLLPACERLTSAARRG
ncbi:MAG: LLM class flavin-dependent oxidoreductase [Stackebrandtia sp.]